MNMFVLLISLRIKFLFGAALDFVITVSHIFLQKNLDFTLKVVGGEITAIPGISDSIEVWELLF